jgi:ribosome biogenesis GTPase
VTTPSDAQRPSAGGVPEARAPLCAIGWDASWEALLPPPDVADADGLEVARVIAQERSRWTVRTALGDRQARLVAEGAVAARPVVGDWVRIAPGPATVDPWSVRDVLPRRTAIARAAAGAGAALQVLAANVDVVWVVHALDAPPNERRLERYLAVVWESGAVPEVLLTKADLADDPAVAVAQVRAIAPGVTVRAVRIDDRASVDALGATLAPGTTVCLIGPSGAGKSTLVNALAGATLTRTGAVRAGDAKGRHTTTRRTLFPLPGGACLLDSPGLRELRVWTLDEGLAAAFPDVAALASACRYRDCRHAQEPGCAVRAAVEAGRLPLERLASFRKLEAEAKADARRHDPFARAAAVADHKTALKTMKHHPKYRT